MPGVTFNKFNSFVENLAEKKYNLQSDTLMIALTDVAPSASNVALSEITQIAYTNLPTSRVVTVSSSAQTSGLYKLICAIMTLISTGGNVASFRYAVLYDSTATGFELIGWYDYGAEIVLQGANADELILNFDQTSGVINIQ